MFNLKELLWNTLQNLQGQQFKHFQWFLKQDDIVDGVSAIPEARLEKADRQDTVDLMVQTHGLRDTLEVTKRVLEKIGRNDLVQHLCKSSSSLKDLKSYEARKCEYEKQKTLLGETKTEIMTMIQERKRKICEIQHSAELSKKSADRQSKDSEQVFTVLLRSVGRILANLIEDIREKQDATQKRAEAFIRELEKEISQLTRRSAELEQLSHIEDHDEFLQSCSPLHFALPTSNCTDVHIQPPSYGRSVGGAVSQLKEELGKHTERLIADAKFNRVQQFAMDVTLDPDTANPYLVLSDDGKQVYCGDKKRNLPENPKRFNAAINVLAKQGISSGRFYYEVQVQGSSSWDLGVVRESINRKGSIQAKPEDGYWTVCLRGGRGYKASSVNLTVKSPPQKVGVFVDYSERSVSFYDAHSADLLHCFTECSFEGKLYPFLSPSLHRGENPTPLIISSVSIVDKI